MVDASLKALDVEFIDLMQFHVWRDDFASQDGWKNTIQKITKKGKIVYDIPKGLSGLKIKINSNRAENIFDYVKI